VKNRSKNRFVQFNSYAQPTGIIGRNGEQPSCVILQNCPKRVYVVAGK